MNKPFNLRSLVCIKDTLAARLQATIGWLCYVGFELTLKIT